MLLVALVSVISYHCILSLFFLCCCEELKDQSTQSVENARLNSLGQVAVSGKLYFCSKFITFALCLYSSVHRYDVCMPSHTSIQL